MSYYADDLTPGMVEAAAEAIADVRGEHWHRLSEFHQQAFRDVARAALLGALLAQPSAEDRAMRDARGAAGAVRLSELNDAVDARRAAARGDAR